MMKSEKTATRGRAVFAFMLGCFGLPACTTGGEDVQYDRGRIEIALPNLTANEEVDSFAEQRIDTHSKALASRLEQPAVRDALRKANGAHESLQLDEILNLDAKWQEAASGSAFVAGRVDEGCNAYLSRVMRVMPGFVEIFVTDRKGLVVCQTNKTTDYYQADEAWWIEAYDEGKGRAAHSALEYDQSAETYAVAVAVPVYEEGSRHLIGIAKGALEEAREAPVP